MLARLEKRLDELDASGSTACWRRCIGVWRLDDEGILWLECVNTEDGAVVFSGAELVPEFAAGSRARAGWFSGEIRYGTGNLVYYQHDGFMRNLEREWVAAVSEGRVRETKAYRNRLYERGADATDNARVWPRRSTAFMSESRPICCRCMWSLQPIPQGGWFGSTGRDCCRKREVLLSAIRLTRCCRQLCGRFARCRAGMPGGSEGPGRNRRILFRCAGPGRFGNREEDNDAYCSGLQGSVNQKVEPLPGRDSTPMRPPIVSTIDFEIASPMPDALPERSRLDETLEKLSPVFFGDAGSRVGDVDVEFPAADFEPEIDGAFGGEFHGVAQKVGDHLNQPFAVRADVADGIFSVEGDPHRAVLRLPHAETAFQLFHDGIEFHVGIFVAEGSGPRSSRDRGCRRVAVSVPRRWSG